MAPPNSPGLDQFYFIFSKNGIEPKGYNSDYSITIDTTTKSNNTAWVIKAENEDYNKCTGLSWPGNTTCN